jgi:co-chaperonin GroES (HSP10)
VGHKILIEPKEVEKVSEGGIHLVYENERLVQVSEQLGKLVAIGPTAWNAHVIQTENGHIPGKRWAEIGDKVWYSKFAGSFITDPETGKDYVLMNDEDISAVFDGEIDV